MKKLLLIPLIFAVEPTFACITCNKQLQKGIYDSTFYPNLLAMLSAFLVLIVINTTLTRLATNRYNARLIANPSRKELASVPLASAAALLGIGIGGFADGIILHQILQWHEMLTNKIPADTVMNKSINMFWDGIFHLFTLITTSLGVLLMWKLLKRENINKSGFLLTGGFLGGWGLFNLVEGVIDHHILKLHNVRELASNQDVWNFGFLGMGLVMLVVGWMLIKKGTKEGIVS